MSLDALIARARGEFREMPGLLLTSEQACRLWQVDAAICEAILSALVAERFFVGGLTAPTSHCLLRGHGRCGTCPTCRSRGPAELLTTIALAVAALLTPIALGAILTARVRGRGEIGLRAVSHAWIAQHRAERTNE